MAKEYVPIFYDWLDTTQDLSAEEKGNLIDAIISYASDCEYEHLLSDKVKIAFRFMKGAVDRSNEISAKRSKAASSDTSENKTEQSETNGNKTEQTETNTNDKDNNNNNNNNKDKNDNKNRFVAPTLDEVKAYMSEIGCEVDPQYFLDYQEARNWVLSNGKKAKDWRAVIRTWKHNNFTRQPTSGTYGVKKVVAQQYTQRDFDGEQEEAERRTIEEAIAWRTMG